MRNRNIRKFNLMIRNRSLGRWVIMMVSDSSTTINVPPSMAINGKGNMGGIINKIIKGGSVTKFPVI